MPLRLARVGILQDEQEFLNGLSSCFPSVSSSRQLALAAAFFLL